MPSSVNRIAVLEGYGYGRGRGRGRRYRGIVTLGRRRRYGDPSFWDEGGPGSSSESDDFDGLGRRRGRGRRRSLRHYWDDGGRAPIEADEQSMDGFSRKRSAATSKRMKACALKWKRLPEKKRARMKWTSFISKHC